MSVESTQTKPLLCVDLLIFSKQSHTKSLPARRCLLGDGILQTLDALEENIIIDFDLELQRIELVFSTANNSHGSYRSALMTSCCRDAFSEWAL